MEVVTEDKGNGATPSHIAVTGYAGRVATATNKLAKHHDPYVREAASVFQAAFTLYQESAIDEMFDAAFPEWTEHERAVARWGVCQNAAAVGLTKGLRRR